MDGRREGGREGSRIESYLSVRETTTVSRPGKACPASCIVVVKEMKGQTL